MLGWIPIIGPIIDGIFSIFRKQIDYKTIQYKTDGSVDIEGIKASASIIAATKDDIGVRITRDIICFPVAVWTALYSWDTIWAEHNRAYMWHVADFPKEVAYLPLAVITFLLGNVGFNVWRRK